MFVKFFMFVPSLLKKYGIGSLMLSYNPINALSITPSDILASIASHLLFWVVIVSDTSSHGLYVSLSVLSSICNSCIAVLISACAYPAKNLGSFLGSFALSVPTICITFTTTFGAYHFFASIES